MRFEEFVNEQLTTYTTIRIVKDNHTHFTMEYQVDDVLYRVYCESATDEWEVKIDAIQDFKEKKPHPAVVMTNPNTVLNTFVKCIDMFLEKKNPQGFEIITKNDSMKRVINRIVPGLKPVVAKRKQHYIGRTSSGYVHKFMFNKEPKEDK